MNPSMIPSWVLTTLIVVLGCIGALWLGPALADEAAMTGWDALILVLGIAACVICAVYNNFPLLLAIGSWIPFFPHFGLASLPTVTFFLIWMAGVLFFRLCIKGYLHYRQSFSWFLLITFAWVPVRFLMNPVYKLGSTAGGSGVSGISPYFDYALAAGMLIFLGAVLYDREKVIAYLRWCFVVVLFSGLALTACAFIPATRPYLASMGSYQAGDMGDGIQRLVQLPGYGLYLVEVAICPVLFRLKAWQATLLFFAGFGMIILGGNRSAIAAVLIVVPFVFFVRRKPHMLALIVGVLIVTIVSVKIAVAGMDESQIPELMRSFGFMDKKIDEASGGQASAEWRYAIWSDGIRKIMEAPLTGKGYGNLPQHMQINDGGQTADFESVLAGGEAHNGFISAAYGFGIPFTVALSIAIVWFLVKEFSKALTCDNHDLELREIHAFIGGMFISYPILIYTAFDLSSGPLWTYAAISCILSHLPRRETQPISVIETSLRKYGSESRTAGAYSYRGR